MKKKLLIIDHSGVVDLYRERARILAKDYEYDVSMIIPNKWNEGSKNIILNKNDKIKIYNSNTILTNNIPLFMYNPFVIIKAMINEKPDIIDIHEEPYSLSALEVIVLKNIFSRKSKVVFYSAQNILKKYPWPIRVFEKIVCSNSQGAYTCSTEVTKVLKERSFKGLIKEIPLGIDENIFFKKNKNYINDKFKIGFIGRLEKSKGIINLIHALGKLKSKNWECSIVGNGSLYNSLSEVINKENLTDKVKLLGSIDPENIPAYINSIDILIVPSLTTPSWKEQFGRVIVEAFACGKPVIGSDSGAIPEVISTGGIIFSENNIEELALKIDEVINNNELYEYISKNALQQSQKYTWNKIAKEFDDLYNKVIKIDK